MSRLPKPTTVDFETMGINKRPHYPPIPVSVSIKEWGKKPKFYAWGHITGGNNCTWQEAKQALAKVWEHDDLLFQNAKFDLAVAEKHFGLAPPLWQRVHDTLLLLFLDDPRQTELSLKPAAERLLGWAPEEQDAVADWLIQHQPVTGVKISKAKGPNYFGAFIAYCPGDIVGKYADGDVLRTEGLYKHLYPSIRARDMLTAYDRERRCLAVLMDMEKQGVPIDTDRLRSDVAEYRELRDKLTNWLYKQLKATPDALNIDSDKQLLDALIQAKKVDPAKLILTEKGNQSASKESLAGAMTDRRMAAALATRSELNTCLGTFMENWLYTAELSDGYIYTDWNQVRQPNERGKGVVGARTGRLSSTPNFQNIPNEFTNHWEGLKPPFPLRHMPLVRSYVAPFPGHVLLDRDYSQQELRILGHYEEGPLYDAYHENPWMDAHDWAKDMINDLLGTAYPRKPIKNIGFGLLYGMGLGLLAIKASTDTETARMLKNAYLKVAPGLKQMYQDMRIVARNDECIRTWGGREYKCEEPKFVNGRLREFDYKLVNVLIQGGAADITKEAFVRYYDTKPGGHALLLTVHDELLGSCPRAELKDGMEAMRAAMESIELDVPLLSEGDWSDTNWAELQVYDKAGELKYAA